MLLLFIVWFAKLFEAGCWNFCWIMLVLLLLYVVCLLRFLKQQLGLLLNLIAARVGLSYCSLLSSARV
jgi:hypothetical protein